MTVAESSGASPRELVVPSLAPGLVQQRRLLLAAIVLAGVALKLALAPFPVGHHALDGSYFFQVARHLADGDGLVTSVSLYHQGLRELPHASLVYPLWPVLLGAGGALIGLERAAVVLPPLFYVLSLVLLYVLANRLAGRWREGGESITWRPAATDGVLTVGHLGALLFAVNRVYFQHTSLPYSEGLAFCLALAALLAVDRVRPGALRDLPWAALAGALAGLAFLARSQMAGLAAALPAAFWLAMLGRRGSRGATLLAGLVSAGAAIAVTLPWVLHLAGMPSPALPRALFDFTAYRETAELEPFRLMVRTSGTAELLRDRASGIAVAFAPQHPFSYARSFGLAVYLVPLALLAAVTTLGRAPGAERAAAPELTSRCGAPVTGLATSLAALLCLIPTHLHHATYIWPWWFHWRHGLPMVFAIVVALAWLNARVAPWWRVVAALLVGWTLLAAPFQMAGLARDLGARARGPHPDESALVDWVAAQAEPPTLVATKPQVLAAFGRGGRYHWIDCKDSPAQLAAMLRHLRVDGVVVYPGEASCAWAATLASQGLRPRSFGAITLWQRG